MLKKEIPWRLPMKKISNTEIASLISIQTITLYTGININLIKNATGINIWISILLADLIGLIPICLYLYIAKYKPNLKINEKINDLYKNSGRLLNLILNIIILILGITILYNITNFITSQLLYRTPQIMIIIFLILVAIYNANEGIETISRVSLIMLSFNLILFLISFISLSSHINLDNFLPILKDNPNKIILSSLKLTSINFLPILITLVIPKDNARNKEHYNKSIIKGYILGIIISFLVVITTYGVLGPYLVNIFEYPEYIVLKKVTLLGFLERIENIVSNQWIIGNYVYLTLIIYYLGESCLLSKKVNTKYLNILFGTILILASTLIFKNNTIFHSYVKNILPYFTSLLIIIYILLTIKIFLTSKKNKTTQSMI